MLSTCPESQILKIFTELYFVIGYIKFIFDKVSYITNCSKRGYFQIHAEKN